MGKANSYYLVPGSMLNAIGDAIRLGQPSVGQLKVSQMAATIKNAIKTSTSVVIDKNKVYVPAGTFTEAYTYEVAIAARAKTNLDIVANTSRDEATITATNNQATGYVEGSNESAQIKATIAANGSFVSTTFNDTTAIVKEVAHAIRADTVLSLAADENTDTLTIHASNNQQTGWVDGEDCTADATVALTANKNIVTATLTDGSVTKSVSKTIAAVDRAKTISAISIDDTNDTITINATNNQGTGYVTGTKEDTSVTVKLSAAKDVITAEADGYKISKSVGTATRANTSIRATKNTTDNTLVITAENNQSTGYVTGSNESASTTVRLSKQDDTVSVEADGATISTSVDHATRAATSIEITTDEAAHKLTIYAANDQKTGYVTGSNQAASTAVTLTASGNTITASASDGTSVSRSVSTVTRAGTTVKVTADDTADTLKIDASNKQGTGWVTGSDQTATTTISLSSSGKTVTATATDGTKVSRSVADGSVAVTGGSLTKGDGAASATGTGISLEAATITPPSSGSYITVKGSGKVKRAAIIKTQTAGYISNGTSTAIAEDEISSNEATLYYKVNTDYPVPEGDIQLTSSGTHNVAWKETATIADGQVSASGSISNVTIPIITAVPGNVSISESSDNVIGKTKVTASPTTSNTDITKYYVALSALADAGNVATSSADVSGTANASVSTAGFVDSSDNKSTVLSATASASAITQSKSSDTYYIPLATGSFYATGSISNQTVNTSPGDVTVEEINAAIESKIQVDTSPTTTTAFNGKYYMAVQANTAANSSTSSISGYAYASVSSAGYIDNSISSDYSSLHGTTTTNVAEKSSDYYYLPITEGKMSADITAIDGINLDGCTTSLKIDENRTIAGKIPIKLSTGQESQVDKYFLPIITNASTKFGYAEITGKIKPKVDTSGYVSSTDTTTDETSFNASNVSYHVAEGPENKWLLPVPTASGWKTNSYVGVEGALYIQPAAESAGWIDGPTADYIELKADGLKSTNIKAGVSIFGINGTYDPISSTTNGTLNLHKSDTSAYIAEPFGNKDVAEIHSTNTSVATVDYDASSRNTIKIFAEGVGECLIICTAGNGGLATYKIKVDP